MTPGYDLITGYGTLEELCQNQERIPQDCSSSFFEGRGVEPNFFILKTMCHLVVYHFKYFY